MYGCGIGGGGFAGYAPRRLTHGLHRVHATGAGDDQARDLVGGDEDSENEEGEHGGLAIRAARGHGPAFSTATRIAITTIHVRLIAPSANNPAISAHEEPRHHRPLRAPMRSEGGHARPELESRTPSWPRQRVRQACLNGTNS